jgi:hypothetical protein
MENLNLKPGQIMLVNAKGVANGKVSLEFAQIVDTGRKSLDLTSLINEDDDRFNTAKPRRAWMVGTKASIGKYFSEIADAIEALAEGEVLEIGQLNPEISGKQLNLQIVETINGTDYDKANIATKAKRAGADGDYIVTSKGENIFTKVSVVVGEPRHFFFEETVRKNTGAASNAIIEALGE